MKKVFLLFIAISSTMLISCGGDKKKEADQQKTTTTNPSNNDYTVIIQAIYEKDDNISIALKRKGVWDYDHPVSLKVSGSPVAQQIPIYIPVEDSNLENMQIEFSSNKEQKTLDVKAININKNGKEILNGANNHYSKYFNAGTGFKWDDKKMRFNLVFDGPYPPRMMGSEQLEALLSN